MKDIFVLFICAVLCCCKGRNKSHPEPQPITDVERITDTINIKKLETFAKRSRLKADRIKKQLRYKQLNRSHE